MRVSLLVFLSVLSSVHAEPVTISPAKLVDGVRIHTVRTALQAKPTLVRVLLPDKLQEGRTYPVLYLLPVEAGTRKGYGDGLVEAKKLDLANKNQLIVVAPTFAHLPWYADHPTDKSIQQETYFIDVVLPFVSKTYPASRKPSEHFLLGYSKSGWGAFSLLLRNPTKFGKAVAWDSPFMMDKHGPYGSGPIFGTRENFLRYQLTRLTARTPKDKSPRLIILGQGNFQSEHERFHAHLEKVGYPHVYKEGTKRKHHWSSGWVAEAVELLLAE